MKREEILSTIEWLSHSQEYYGRVLRDLQETEKEDPAEYENAMQILEAQDFHSAVDLVNFFEAGMKTNKETEEKDVS